MQIHKGRVSTDDIMSPANREKRLRMVLLSIFEDLQCRLMFRFLPVRSRFWFLKATIPNIRHCVRNGCGAIETEQHLFSAAPSRLSSGVMYSVWHQKVVVTTYRRTSAISSAGYTRLVNKFCFAQHFIGYARLQLSMASSIATLKYSAFAHLRNQTVDPCYHQLFPIRGCYGHPRC
ncbi:unnamed protein product [Peronospora effusa]|uniref:Uncharacterized protein n=1 Tax=Peronospora effusa TaxID=542832 RepID=A0A3R7XRA8_9STRA|nr:hypothetical protein DD237_007864 [Peronospora effusa]CAI5715639.1 unnamed protein product [Peronospora effusa]